MKLSLLLHIHVTKIPGVLASTSTQYTFLWQLPYSTAPPQGTEALQIEISMPVFASAFTNIPQKRTVPHTFSLGKHPAHGG